MDSLEQNFTEVNSAWQGNSALTNKSMNDWDMETNDQGALPSSFYKDLVFEEQDENKRNNLAKFGNYIRQNNPSYKLLEEEIMRAIREEYKKLEVEGKNPLQFFMARLIDLYKSSSVQGINPTIPRVLMKTIAILKNQFKKDFGQNIKEMGLLYWTDIDPSHFKAFLNTFEIANEVDFTTLIPKINELKSQNKLSDVVNYIMAGQLQNHFNFEELIPIFINQSKFRDAALLAKDNIDLQKLFIKEMCATKNASRAADFIKDFNKDPNEFPELLEVLNKNALRFHSHNDHWMKVEEKFFNLKQILAYFVEYLIEDENFDPAISIIKRHNLLDLGLIKKNETIEDLAPYFTTPPQKSFNYLENILFTKDDYCSTEEILGLSTHSHYLKLTEFGINPEKDIIWIDNCESGTFVTSTAEILNAKMIGVDSEHRFNINKFDHSDTSILQIATLSKIYLFDVLKLSSLPQYCQFVRSLLSNQDILKVGHTLENDLRLTKDNQEIVIKGNVDLPKIYKAVYPETRHSSLAYICEQILNLGISKCEQLSEWERRPLRKAQIHYAAVDAYIPLKLYEKLKEQVEAKGEDISKYIQITTAVPQINTKKAKKTAKENLEQETEAK